VLLGNGTQNQFDSQLNGSQAQFPPVQTPLDIEEEYGYNSEEESIFQSFVQDSEKNIIPKTFKQQSTKKESHKVKKEV
jgi:hypothetical protein